MSAAVEAGEAGPEAVSVSRTKLVSVLRKRTRRARQCRSVPLSLTWYCVFIWAMVTHTQNRSLFPLERGLRDGLVMAGSGFYPDTPPPDVAAWAYWLQTSFLPAALTQTGPGDVPLPLEARGMVLSGKATILGGLRLTQTRAAATPCPAAAITGSVLPATCISASELSTLPFAANDTVAAEAGWLQAFYTSQVPGDTRLSGSTAFQAYLSAYEDVAVTTASLTALLSLGWLDRYSKEVCVSTVLLAPDIPAAARVGVCTSYNAGTLRDAAAASARIDGVLLDPYANAPELYPLDIVMIIYWAYLLFGSIKRVIRTCLVHKRWRDRLLWKQFTWTKALDWGCVLLYMASMAAWGEYYKGVLVVRDQLKGMGPLNPALQTGQPPADTFPPQWAQLDVQLATCATALLSFKWFAVLTLITLSLRLFKYLAFQARLAVLSEAFKRALSDASHFGVLFGLFLVLYGVWAHVAFGNQSPDWSDPSQSAIAIWRFMMYDYDLAPMKAVDPQLANLFYASFMMLMTNLLLWMFFAVWFDNYTVVRLAAQEWPSFAQETAAFTRSIPLMVDVPALKAKVTGCCARKAGTGRAHSIGKEKDRVTWGDTLRAVTGTGPLASQEQVTAEQLRNHLGLSEPAAHMLVADIASTQFLAGSSVYYGHDLPGGPRLPSDMRTHLERLFPGLRQKEAKGRSGGGGGGDEEDEEADEDEEELDEDVRAGRSERVSVIRHLQRTLRRKAAVSTPNSAADDDDAAGGGRSPTRSGSSLKRGLSLKRGKSARLGRTLFAPGPVEAAAAAAAAAGGAGSSDAEDAGAGAGVLGGAQVVRNPLAVASSSSSSVASNPLRGGASASLRGPPPPGRPGDTGAAGFSMRALLSAASAAPPAVTATVTLTELPPPTPTATATAAATETAAQSQSQPSLSLTGGWARGAAGGFRVGREEEADDRGRLSFQPKTSSAPGSSGSSSSSGSGSSAPATAAQPPPPPAALHPVDMGAYSTASVESAVAVLRALGPPPLPPPPAPPAALAATTAVAAAWAPNVPAALPAAPPLPLPEAAPEAALVPAEEGVSGDTVDTDTSYSGSGSGSSTVE